MKKKQEKMVYFTDPVQNAAFICCVDILAELIEKYGDRVLLASTEDDIAITLDGNTMLFEWSNYGRLATYLKSYVNHMLKMRSAKT